MKKVFLISTITLLILSGCGQREQGRGLNLFSIQQDKELGAQVAQEIESNPQQYPILDSSINVEAYRYLYEVRDRILNSGNVRHKDEFVWRLRIIHDDNTLNAFCTPGGYIYFYTGIMKYLDAEDQLAGVMAHEIAHADYRHSTRQMTRMFGVQTLLSILAGDKQLLKDVTGAIVGLKFSRNHETEADKGSVLYLCPSEYDAAGGAKFFEKIQAAGGARGPEFLSTHPNPENRIEDFYTEKIELGCTGDQDFKTRYQAFLAILPN